MAAQAAPRATRCTAITDPLGHVSRAVYDAAGRLVKNVDADGRVIEIGYDDAGLEALLNVDGRPFSRTSRDAKARMRTIEDFSDPGRPLTHINARLIRANMLEIQNACHVSYAKTRGISSLRVLFSHVFRNASLPIVTALGMHLGELIGGAIVIENRV